MKKSRHLQIKINLKLPYSLKLLVEFRVSKIHRVAILYQVANLLLETSHFASNNGQQKCGPKMKTPLIDISINREIYVRSIEFAGYLEALSLNFVSILLFPLNNRKYQGSIILFSYKNPKFFQRSNDINILAI